jgi:hypothetical protein
MAIRLLSSESINGALTLTGNLTGTTAGFSGSITASGNSNSFGNTTIGALAASTGTFSASVTAAGNSNSFGTSTFTGNISGVRGFFNSGATNVVATFTSTDGTATLQCADPTGNVEFGASGNNFVVQPAGGVAQLTVGSSSSTFAGNVKLTDEKILGLRTSTTDYALQYRDLDFRLIGSADGTTQRKFSFGYYTSDNPAGTWNGKTYINSYTGNVGIGTATVNSKLEIYSTATFDPRTSGINIHRPGSFGQYGSIAYNVNETVISSTYTGTGATDYGSIKFQQFNNGTVPRVVMFLNTAGNVGIGTVTPSVKLEIFGNNSARNTLQNILAINGGTNSNNVYSGFGMGLVFSGRDYSNQPRDYAYIYGVQQASSTNTPGGDPGFTSQLTFYTNTGGAVNTLPTQKMVINALGNVGINVANPGFQAVDGYGQIGIEIKGGKENNQAPCIRLHETGSGKGSFELRSTRNILTSGNYFAIAEGTDTFFAIRGDDDGGGTSTRGYVGIGTESPVNKLDIRNGELTVRPSSSGNGGLGKIGYSSNNSIIQLYDSSGNEDVRISTSLSSYFNGGNVGIGTTSPDYELDVNGSIRAGRVTTNVEYYSTTNSASNQYFHIKTSVNANSQTCMHTWSVEGYAYGSTAIIDCKLAFHTDSSNNIYGRSYLGSLANNIYRSGDNYVVLVFGTVNTYYTHFYINLFEGMYTPLNSTVLAVSYSPNNSGVY